MGHSASTPLYWTHFLALEECPQKYLWTYGWEGKDLGYGDGKPIPQPKDSKHHAVLGIVIQKVLEDATNFHWWKNREGLEDRLREHTKVEFARELNRTYIDWSVSPAMGILLQTCIDGVLGFLQTEKHYGFWTELSKSEVEFKALKDGMKLYGRADWCIPDHPDGMIILDGKNSSTPLKYDKPDQLRWYALCAYASGSKMPDKLGFVWYRFPYEEGMNAGVDWVTCTNRDLVALEARAKRAQTWKSNGHFPATPSTKACQFCPFKDRCEAYQNRPKRARKSKSSEEATFADIHTFYLGED